MSGGVDQIGFRARIAVDFRPSDRLPEPLQHDVGERQPPEDDPGETLHEGRMSVDLAPTCKQFDANAGVPHQAFHHLDGVPTDASTVMRAYETRDEHRRHVGRPRWHRAQRTHSIPSAFSQRCGLSTAANCGSSESLIQARRGSRKPAATSAVDSDS